MEETQVFRLSGTTEIIEVPIDHLDGQKIIYWDDIEDVFPGIKLIMNGSVAVNKLRDSTRKRIEPHCIKHHPGPLDIILFSSNDHAHVSAPAATPSLTPAQGSVSTSADASSDAPAVIHRDNAGHTQSDLCHLVAIGDGLQVEQALSLCSTASEASLHVASAEFVSSLAIASRSSSGHAITEQRQGLQMVFNKLDVLYDQGAMTQQIAQEVSKLQKQMNDRLILIQNKTEAILTQQLEIAEYPIPRLFIVLPEEPVKYDPANWFRTKFRLHFICECGEHTEAANSKIKHHLHLAKHEGYIVREPTKFFERYGPFLLLMLELIKFGTAVAGHVVPALATLQAVELVDTVKQSVELITAKIDLSLECIDKQLTKVQSSLPEDSVSSESQAIRTPQELDNYLNGVEGVEGVELPQLRSFLKTSDEETLLGNLYRMTTSDGHVKWVCRDHYRASYQEKQVEKLREVVKLARGQFDEQLGKIKIALTSSFEAVEFYTTVRKAQGVLELDISLRWECNKGDLDTFRAALRSSRVSIVRNLVKLPDFTAKRPSQNCRLSVIWTPTSVVNECQELATVLRTNSILTSLVLRNKSIGPGGMQVLARALKVNAILTTLDLQRNSIGDSGGQALADALKINKTLTNLALGYNSIDDSAGQALAEALKINNTLTNLNLSSNPIRDSGGQALAEALKVNKTLTNLDMSGNSIKDSGGQALAEALKVNKTLTNLALGYNSIGNSGGQALAEALKINKTLTNLDLKRNSIGDSGGQALAEALKINKTLTDLDLSFNSIKDSGGKALAKALKINNTLTNLDLERNSIGDNGGQALAEALKINKTLTNLDLSFNSIKDRGGQALAKALKINKTLTNLDLSFNSIKDRGGQALAKALKINKTLTNLDLSFNSIKDSGGQALANALRFKAEED
ncbi:unnamed protein product [Mortierella alpina]